MSISAQATAAGKAATVCAASGTVPMSQVMKTAPLPIMQTPNPLISNKAMKTKLNPIQEWMLRSGMLDIEPEVRLVAKYVGTAGDLLKQCEEVLGKRRTLAVSCTCNLIHTN